MPITTDELHNRIDENASTKSELEEALHEHSDHYRGLSEVDADAQTRKEMLSTAEEAIEEGLTRQGKIGAISALLDDRPDTVILLRRQAFWQIDHPETDESFQITVFDDMDGMRQTEGIGRGEPDEPGQIDVNTTPLAEVPEWAYPDVYDQATAGTIDLFDSPQEAQKAANKQVQDGGPTIVDDPSATPRLDEVEVESGMGTDGTESQVRATADFGRPEQKAAWALLNKRSKDGEPPLPSDASKISSDESEIHPAERDLVRSRIERCLAEPEMFEESADKETFDERVFLDQLLECELKGFNAPRPGSASDTIGRVTRPAVIQLIRQFAEDLGYEVLGDHVRPKPKQPETDLPETNPASPDVGGPELENSGLGESIRTDDPYQQV